MTIQKIGLLNLFAKLLENLRAMLVGATFEFIQTVYLKTNILTKRMLKIATILYKESKNSCETFSKIYYYLIRYIPQPVQIKILELLPIKKSLFEN